MSDQVPENQKRQVTRLQRVRDLLNQLQRVGTPESS